MMVNGTVYLYEKDTYAHCDVTEKWWLQVVGITIPEGALFQPSEIQ